MYKSSLKEFFKYSYFAVLRAFPPQMRFGKTFMDTYRFLQRSQWWTKEQIREYQVEELRRLVTHAYRNVPYYTKLFDEHAIDPAQIQDFDDFKKIPYLTKELVNQNAECLKSTAHSPSRLRPATTSGTSGKTMKFWRDYSENGPRERAIVWRMWNLYGYSWNDKSVIIKGHVKLHSQAVVYNPSDKSLGFFNPVFRPENVKEYLKLIQDHKPAVIRGYPSLIHSLAHAMLSNNLQVQWPWLRFIYCHSEKVFSSQIDAIETAFSTKVRYNYGHTERCVFMHTCESNDEYHILPEYGYTEFIPNPADPSMGEIVGTGFYNYGFPFIRYRTRDWATLPHANECVCGRNFKLVHEIFGRSGDFIVTPSGGLVSPTILEMSREHTINYNDILIRQYDKENIEILIVPEDGYTCSDGQKIKNIVKERIGEPVNITINTVDVISRTGNDKKRFVISDIANKYLNKLKQINES